MELQDKIEKKNRRIGMITSVLIQLALLILFYFLIAWKAPFPPIPEYGIELGFIQSSGASAPTQPSTPPTSQPAPAEEIEEVLEESEPQETNEVESEDIPVDEVTESEVPVEAEPQETFTEEVLNEEEATAETPIEEVSEEVVEDTETTEVSETETNETEEQTEPAEKVEESMPVIDERAIYGSQGTDRNENAGASLSLSGWIWDFKPEPEDESDETGKIEYKIVVDEDGYLLKIELIVSTVSPSVERKYRESVQKLTFSKTSDYQPAPLSTGTLTFIIKSK